MSVIIHNFSMPTACWECPCHNGATGECKILKMTTDYIPRVCPMEEIKELEDSTNGR